MGGKILGFPTQLVVLVVLVGCYFYVPAFNAAVNDLWGSITGLTPGSVVTTGGIYTGNINFVESIQDGILGSTLDPTGDAYYWFPTQPSSMAGAVTLTAAGHVKSALPSGFCWVVVEAGSSDNLLLSDALVSMNAPYVVDSFWADLSNDNSADFCMKIDTSKVGINGQAQTPTLNLVIPFVNEDATLTLSSPADNDNLGAAEVTTSTTWTITDCANDDGFNIGRLYFTCNKTIASGEFKPEQLTISNGLGLSGQSVWSAPIAKVEGSTSYYYYIGADTSPDYRHVFNGELYGIRTGEPTTIYVQLTYKTTLTSGDLVTLYVDQIDGDGTVTTDSDAINANIIS